MDWDDVRARLEETAPAAACAAGPEAPVDAFEREPADRSDDDVRRMAEHIGSLHLPLVDEYFDPEERDATLLTVCRALRYETAAPRETLFRAGDRSEKFYIVVAGSVSVWEPRSSGGAAATKSRILARRSESSVRTPCAARFSAGDAMGSFCGRRRSRRSVGPGPLGARPGSALSINPDDTDDVASFKSDRSNRSSVRGSGGLGASAGSGEVFVGFMMPGGPTGTFGEVGLLSESHTRSASVRAGPSGVQLLTLDRAAFDLHVGERFEAAVRARCDVLRAFSIFHGVDDAHLRVLATLARRRVVRPGEMVAREGGLATAMFCLASGSLELVRDGAAKAARTASVSRGTLSGIRPKRDYFRVALISSGSVVGQREALGTAKATPFRHGVRAVEEAVVWQIEREAYLLRVRRDIVGAGSS